MKLTFDENKIDTILKHKVHSLIMEEASEIAEAQTSIRCDYLQIEEHKKNEDGFVFTEEAQDIFNEFYDTELEQLYKLINNVLKII